MGKVGTFRREAYEKQERALVSALGAVARCDPEQVAGSYVRREGGQAYVVAKREGASVGVLQLIRQKLRERRGR